MATIGAVEVTLDTADGPMAVIGSLPSEQVKGAVVVIQEAFGLTHHIAEICERLAAAGWLAVAPALYHRIGSPVESYDNMAGASKYVQQLSYEGLQTDIFTTIDYLNSEGYADSKIGTVGFCMGGSAVAYIAALRSLGAGVTFYGSGLRDGRWGGPPLIEAARDFKTPWLGLFGDQDASIPFDQVEEMRDAAKSSDVATEIVRYANAGHGFNCNERPAHFNADAAADAWQRTLRWFDENIS